MASTQTRIVHYFAFAINDDWADTLYVVSLFKISAAATLVPNCEKGRARARRKEKVGVTGKERLEWWTGMAKEGGGMDVKSWSCCCT